ncbi:MAG: winged helix-turn-helix transcriptional regulator [Pleomorphochaeta sp.]
MIKENFRLREKSYSCYFELTLDLIGGKWKPVILYHIGQNDVLRYAQIKKCIPKITERMLSKQLKELESDGIVNRKVYPVIPPKVEYRLTEKGKALIPLLYQLRDWGEVYFNDNIDMFDHKELEQEN